MTSIRAVLFDFGDTLFASPDAVRVIVEEAEARGTRVDEATARALWAEIWEMGKHPVELSKGRDLSAAAHREVWTALFERANALVPDVAPVLYGRVMEPWRWLPYADSEPTLRALKERGRRVGVVSNIAYDLRPVFAAHGLERHVDAFVHSYEHGAAKPARSIFLAACEALGVPPAETLMVGDHPIADGGAAAAGLRVHLLGPWAPGGPRGLAEVLRIVEEAG